MPTHNKCVICRKIFKALSKKARICSEICYEKALNDESIDLKQYRLYRKKCPICGDFFIGSSTRKYDSDDCRTIKYAMKGIVI